jgi:peroxiredoxin-like protein
MTDLPHTYRVKSAGAATGNLTTRAENLPDFAVAPPLQFGGPGDQWSPEDLLMASVSNCLILSFRAIARASQLEWSSIECESVGTLDRVERKVQFTHIVSKMQLCIPKTESKEKAEKLLKKAEGACLISNSISCEARIECAITFNGE